MNLSIKVINIEFIGGSSNVSFLIPKSLENAIKLTNHHVVSNIEFPFFIQERAIDIELHDEGLLSTIIVLSFTLHYRIKLINLINHGDSVSSISKLSWLYYPYISHWPSHIHSVLVIFFLLSNNCLSLFMIRYKSLILRIFFSLFNMKC